LSVILDLPVFFLFLGRKRTIIPASYKAKYEIFVVKYEIFVVKCELTFWLIFVKTGGIKKTHNKRIRTCQKK